MRRWRTSDRLRRGERGAALQEPHARVQLDPQALDVGEQRLDWRQVRASRGVVDLDAQGGGQRLQLQD